MDAGQIIRSARSGSRLSLRGLAARAATSHSTIAAYEARRVVPSAATLDRIVRSAGCTLVVELRPGVGGADPSDRGRELVAVLDLAAQFPARHDEHLTAPVFGR